ncbi:MAG: allophanate hydrolase [Proteobacteria bacterium]|nr:allophanate hydrolase [Pseudomonadota bacterium]
MELTESLDIEALLHRYSLGELTPIDLVESVLARIAEHPDNPIWIHLIDKEQLFERAAELEGDSPDSLPLYGIPFAIKDNIDLAGHPTTAACPVFAYTAARTASAVQRVIDAGAILIGKTNLDQFATGLVGTRSPFGAVQNAFDNAYISGGSSSGSAVAVALGLVSFSFGTDTAGSGRVPAGFNNIVGLKPTKGLLSTSGVVPACRSLDCLSIFGLTVPDAERVLSVAAGFDASDPFSRAAPPASSVLPSSLAGLRIGVPGSGDLEFFGDEEAAGLFADAVEKVRSTGAEIKEIEYGPFQEAANLLYSGPWVAERYVATRTMLEQNPDDIFPVTRSIVEKGRDFNATDAFEASYRLQALTRDAEAVWDEIDILLTPTAGSIYTIVEVNGDPVTLNTNLGYYTNYMNLLDLCGLAVPTTFYGNGLPFGVTLVAPAFRDHGLARLGDQVHRIFSPPLGATGIALPQSELQSEDQDGILVVAVGAHMAGLPLNKELTDRGAKLVQTTKTAPLYEFYALTEFSPPRPGLVRVEEVGSAIECEIWSVPAAHFGSFVDGIPAPLGIGTVTLEDGSSVNGFICETYATKNAENISALGSWHRFVAR